MGCPFQKGLHLNRKQLIIQKQKALVVFKNVRHQEPADKKNKYNDEEELRSFELQMLTEVLF